VTMRIPTLLPFREGCMLAFVTGNILAILIFHKLPGAFSTRGKPRVNFPPIKGFGAAQYELVGF
jgi:hypothetical protein